VTDEAAGPDGDLADSQPGQPKSPPECAELEPDDCQLTIVPPRQGTTGLGFDIAAPGLDSNSTRLVRPPAPISDQRDPPLPPALPLVPQLIEDRPRHRYADDAGVADPFLRRKIVATSADDGDPVPGAGKRRSFLAHSGVRDNVIVDDHHDV
jgi:hypothetical protein